MCVWECECWTLYIDKTQYVCTLLTTITAWHPQQTTRNARQRCFLRPRSIESTNQTYPMRRRMTVRRMRTERRRPRSAAYERRASGAHVQRKGARDLLLLAQSFEYGHQFGQVFVGCVLWFKLRMGIRLGGRSVCRDTSQTKTEYRISRVTKRSGWRGGR